MSINKYEPSSHFFVDYTNLSDPLPANIASDAFGPVDGNETSKYRTTSFVRASSNSKVFAICDGEIMIQPQTGDNTKVNLILKPYVSDSYAPIKIKYFIYRGVNKSDLIDNNILVDVNNSDPNQPVFLQKLWKEFIDFNMPFYEQGIIDTPPETFPAFLIGYDETQSGDILIEHYFKRNTDDGEIIFYQIPSCKKGEYIGNFTGKIGLDVVLDYGDYELTNQDELFKLDLDFARKGDHIFDIASIPNSTPTKIKRYKEYIHQFIDAAAFWGSHIECGTIYSVSMPNGMSSNSDIFTNILHKYQTKNILYFYIQAERGRSYNYYNNSRTVKGIESSTILNDTNGWPIIIKEKTFSGTNNTLNIGLEYLVNPAINLQNISVSLSLIVSRNSLDIYPKVERSVPISGYIETGSITFSINATKSCSNFVLIYGHIKQDSFPVPYFNDLWTVNLGNTLSLPNDEVNLVHWLTYDRNLVKNFDSILNLSATIQHKVIFDNGINQEVIGSNPPTKKRRTYLVALKSNTNQNDIYTTKSFTAGFEKMIPNNDTYSFKLYNEYSFIFYKGEFADNQTSNNISCLALFNNDNYTKKYRYLHLGITEEEFNKLIYDSPIIQTPQLLPWDADNIFFYLDEVTGFSTPNVKKYKLGLQYEDNAGIIQILYPSVANTVYVYTIDGYLFCSSEYADYQPFFKEFPKCKAELRVTQPYVGEFGFDWMRIGDTGALGDVDYKNHIGKLYSNSSHTNIETNTNTYTGYFLQKPKMYNRFELEYNPFPIQPNSNNNIEKYYVPSLTIYPPYVPPTPPTPDLDRQSIFTPPYDDDINRLAKLTFKIDVTIEPVKLELDYDATKFNISPTTLPKTVGSHTFNISIICLTELGTEQLIKVRAYYTNSSGVLDPTGEIVGVLRVKPNSKPLRYSKKILLVNVHTDIVGAGTPPSLIFTIEEQAKFLKKFVRQALSTPIMETVTIDLVANPDPVFNSDFIGTNASGNKYLKDQNSAGQYIIQYLYDYLTTTGPAPFGTAMYADYFKVFFFNDNGIPGRFGFSLPTLNLLADFTNNLPSTTTHEFLHTANVPHTFANYEGSKYAKFTYEPLHTDSIMDYSDFGASPPIPTISLYDWQSEVAKGKFDPEP